MTRTLPHNLDAERAILGGILLHPRAFAEVQGHVEPADFYHPANGAIFATMADLDRDATPIDALTIAARMRADDTIGKMRAVNGEAYFAVLLDAVVTVENIRFHAEMVKGRAVARRLIEAATEIAARGLSDYGDLDDYLSTAQQAIGDVVDLAPHTDPLPMRAVQRESMRRLEERFERKGQLTGITSGMREFDEANGGWQETELTLVAARPGVGKTAWAMFAAACAANAGVPVLFISLEMDRRALFDRHLSAMSRVHATTLRTAKIATHEWARLIRASSDSAALPIWIDDETSQTIAAIRGKARRWRTKSAPADKFPHALVIVDYVQLIQGQREKNASRAEEVGTFSAGLKNLARELRIPVIALAQLNRAVEARGDKRPVLSDLRESGNLEQDADNVCFLHRPSLYDKQADREAAEFIIAKARSGPCAMLPLRWEEQFTRFSDEAKT